MTKVVFQIVKTKVTWSEDLADETWIPQHPQVTARDLADASIEARLKHLGRDTQALDGLNGLMTGHPRFPIERDMFDVFCTDSGFIQTVLESTVRKPTVMLDARKPLFFGGCYELPVGYKCTS